MKGDTRRRVRKTRKARGGVRSVSLARKRLNKSMKRRRATPWHKPGELNYQTKQYIKNLHAYYGALPEHRVRPSTIPESSELEKAFFDVVSEFVESQPSQEENPDYERAMRRLKRALSDKDFKNVIHYLNRLSPIYGYAKYELAHSFLDDARRVLKAALMPMNNNMNGTTAVVTHNAQAAAANIDDDFDALFARVKLSD
jgi:hypothetical protein